VAYSRNKEWESIFDRLIELREKDGVPLGLMIQVDTLCHKIPNFMEKGETGRCYQSLYRTGEHQHGQSGGGEKAPEQAHRISQDAARLEGARHPDDRGVYSGEIDRPFLAPRLSVPCPYLIREGEHFRNEGVPLV
jgi:hypothetical protein